jgi:hypothetical protein
MQITPASSATIFAILCRHDLSIVAESIIRSKSFGDAGTRTFQNSTNFDKFLEKLDGLRLTRY